MKKMIFALGLLSSVGVFANQDQNPGILANEERAFWSQSCNQWRYDFQSGTYGCSFLGFQVQMYDKHDVDSLVMQLNDKIGQLEARVKALETGK